MQDAFAQWAADYPGLVAAVTILLFFGGTLTVAALMRCEAKRESTFEIEEE